VAPRAAPLALKVTVCADPLTTAVAMVDVTVCPCGVVTLLGLALIEKSSEAGALTARAMVVAWSPKPRSPSPLSSNSRRGSRTPSRWSKSSCTGMDAVGLNVGGRPSR